MKLVRRKCGFWVEVEDVKTWEGIEEIQRMTCGGGGTHRVVGGN